MTVSTRQFYCLKCEKYATRAHSEIPLQLIISIERDELTVTEDPRCAAVEISEINLNELTCIHCRGMVVLKTGKWKFIEETK